MNDIDKSADIAEENNAVTGSEASQQGASNPDKSIGSYIKRHWRGEMTLAQSFWLNGFAVDILLEYSLIPAAHFAFDLGYESGLVISAFAMPFVIALMIWQSVGIWRSARRYNIGVGVVSFGGIAMAIALAYIAVTIYYWASAAVATFPIWSRLI